MSARTRKLKVCHVVCTADGGTWMFEQLRELRDRYGFEVAAVVAGERGRLVDKLRSENIPYYVANFAAGMGSPRGILQLPRSVLELAKILRRERFDIVQSHVFASMIIARPAAWLADVPVRLAMIAGPFHLEAYTSRWIDRSTCWMETMLIPACEKSARLCREMSVSKKRLASLITYGPDERKFKCEETPPANIRAEFGWPPNTRVICMVAYFYHRLSVGRWVPTELQGRGIKGHEDLVNAAPIILKEFPEARFLLVGPACGAGGEIYLKEMRELVTNMGLQDRVIFTGFRSDVNSILRDVNVAVQASVSECLGGTIEALLMECPTVATRVGGMVDTVREGKTGVLVNPSDPDDLARGIIQLLRDPQTARALGRNGRQFMLERFTLRRTVDDLAHLYQRLLPEAAKRESYNLLVSSMRLVASIPVFSYLLFRMLFLDMYLPLYLPGHLARARAVPRRFYYFVRYPFIRFYLFAHYSLTCLYYFVRYPFVRLYFFAPYLPFLLRGIVHRTSSRLRRRIP